MAVFEMGVLFISAAIFLLSYKLDKSILRRAVFVFIGVLLFEYFTQALWLNLGLEKWAYLYLDVSWILTLGWTTIIIAANVIVNQYFGKLGDITKFWLWVLVAGIIGVLAELTVLTIGIREYSAAVYDSFSGLSIGILPIESLYYIPVFMILVMSFAKYWEINTMHRRKKK